MILKACFFFIFPLFSALTPPSKTAATSSLQNAASRIHASRKQPSCNARVSGLPFQRPPISCAGAPLPSKRTAWRITKPFGYTEPAVLHLKGNGLIFSILSMCGCGGESWGKKEPLPVSVQQLFVFFFSFFFSTKQQPDDLLMIHLLLFMLKGSHRLVEVNSAAQQPL